MHEVRPFSERLRMITHEQQRAQENCRFPSGPPLVMQPDKFGRSVGARLAVMKGEGIIHPGNFNGFIHCAHTYILPDLERELPAPVINGFPTQGSVYDVLAIFLAKCLRGFLWLARVADGPPELTLTADTPLDYLA